MKSQNKRVRTALSIAAGFVTVATYFVGAAGSAAAQTSTAKPSVSFSFVGATVNHKTKPRLTYKVAHLPKGAKIYLQWYHGSPHAWRNVERLPVASKTVTTPSVSIGKYAYRIRVVRGSAVVVTSASRSLFSEGSINFIALCSTMYVEPCQSNTVQVGDTVFTYADAGSVYNYPSYTQIFTIKATSCSSITMKWASNSGNKSYLNIVESKSSAKSASTPPNTIGTLTTKLDGGPFIIDGAGSGTSLLSETYLNGTATCYTSSGLP